MCIYFGAVKASKQQTRRNLGFARPRGMDAWLSLTPSKTAVLPRARISRLLKSEGCFIGCSGVESQSFRICDRLHWLH